MKPTDMNSGLTAGRLRVLLKYDPDTGIFFLRKNGRRSGHINPGRSTGKRVGRKSRPYWVIAVDGRSYSAARLAFLWMAGSWPENLIDHRDCDSTNDAWNNIRPATGSQNEANKGAYKNNSTGLKGIWPLPDGRYAARIYRNRKSVWLGAHETPELAHMAYASAARAHDGQFARVA